MRINLDGATDQPVDPPGGNDNENQATEPPAPPRTIDEILADHEETLTALLGRTEAQGSALTKIVDYLEARPGGPWSWRHLNPEGARKLWVDLYEWVNWLDDRYLRYLSGDNTRLVTNWYQHPIAVEMLTALMVSHISVYRRVKSAPSFELVEWHERCLFPVFHRMTALSLFPNRALRDDESWPEASATHRDDTAFQTFLTEWEGQKPGHATSNRPPQPHTDTSTAPS